MKMKEAISATGLPEKTIRYYEDRGLVTPETYRQNGRTYHEYSWEDIEALKGIVTLRKAQFTLEEIHRMQQDAGAIQEILIAHQKRLEALQESLEALSGLTDASASDWMALVREIETRRRANPDYVPVLRFGALDPESEEERQAELRRVRDHHARSVSAARIAIISLSVLCIALLFFLLLIGLLTLRNNTKADYSIVYACDIELTDAAAENIKSAAAEVIGDRDENGKIIINIKEVRPQYLGGYDMSGLFTGDYVLFIVTDHEMYTDEIFVSRRNLSSAKFWKHTMGQSVSVYGCVLNTIDSDVEDAERILDNLLDNTHESDHES